MSTVIGYRMVNGGSVKYHRTAGNGAVRNIASLKKFNFFCLIIHRVVPVN